MLGEYHIFTCCYAGKDTVPGAVVVLQVRAPCSHPPLLTLQLNWRLQFLWDCCDHEYFCEPFSLAQWFQGDYLHDLGQQLLTGSLQ